MIGPIVCGNVDWPTHPTRADTKTIVIQCNPHDAPKTFEGQLLVEVEKESIKNFTIQFHREDNFFSGGTCFSC